MESSCKNGNKTRSACSREIVMDFEQMQDYDEVLWLLNGIRTHSTRKEPETALWAKSIGDGVLYDVGANIGAYSLIAAQKNPRLQVCAFEPNYSNFYALTENILKNGLLRIRPFLIALSKSSGFDTFNYASRDMGAALSALGEPIDYKGEVFSPALKMTVPCFSIGDLVQTYGFPAPTHIKLDVDSIEPDILEGAAPVLGGVVSVLVEANKYQFKRVNGVMRSHSFRLIQRVERSQSDNLIYEK